MNENQNVKSTIANRKTYKVIGTLENPTKAPGVDHQSIDELLAVAGNAPVHYACDRMHQNTLSSPVPWRAYKLDDERCGELCEYLVLSGDTTKIPNMLSACQFLIQVTWLPDSGTIQNLEAGKEEAMFAGTLRNMEHIAAASSFVQSLLLLADDAGFRTYWSSGGPLRSEAVFTKLNIPRTEILLGSIFLFPQDVGNAEVKPGSMAEKRGALTDWSVWV